jgi:hypothetical protein
MAVVVVHELAHAGGRVGLSRSSAANQLWTRTSRVVGGEDYQVDPLVCTC